MALCFKSSCLWIVPCASCSMYACAGPAIQSESYINVLVDPPGPFRYIPDFILQSVGEAALKASLSTLQASPARWLRIPQCHSSDLCCAERSWRVVLQHAKGLLESCKIHCVLLHQRCTRCISLLQWSEGRPRSAKCRGCSSILWAATTPNGQPTKHTERRERDGQLQRSLSWPAGRRSLSEVFSRSATLAHNWIFYGDFHSQLQSTR